MIFLAAAFSALLSAQSSAAAQPLSLQWQTGSLWQHSGRGPPADDRIMAGLSGRTLTALEPRATPRTGQEYPQTGMFGVTAENDWFNGYDFKRRNRYYTNGLGLTWVSPQTDAVEGPFFSRLTKLLRLQGPGYRYYTDFSLKQDMYTPYDTASTRAMENDHPYSGLLYLEQAYHVVGPLRDRKHSLIVDFGLVGPYAFGGETQNGFHRLINNGLSHGWGNQVGTEPFVLINYAGERRLWKGRAGTFGADVFAHYGAGAGNFRTFVNAGGEVQFGLNLGDKSANFLNRPGRGTMASLPDDPDARLRNQVYFFAALDAELVLRDITLDGNTLKDGSRVQKNFGVGRMIYGAGVNVKKNIILPNGFNLKLASVFETERFEGQKGPHSYVSLRVEVPFRTSKGYFGKGVVEAVKRLLAPSVRSAEPPEPQEKQTVPEDFAQRLSGSSPVDLGGREKREDGREKREEERGKVHGGKDAGSSSPLRSDAKEETGKPLTPLQKRIKDADEQPWTVGKMVSWFLGSFPYVAFGGFEAWMLGV